MVCIDISMICIDNDEMSLQWGPSQVVFMNALDEDEKGIIRLHPTPVFNLLTLKNKWVLSVSAAGLLQSELDIRVEHMQDGTNVLVITGESEPRKIGENQWYSYKRFQKNVRLPQNVIPDSKSSSFTDSLLLLTFDIEA